MRVDIFDFELPEERIALRPAVPRDSARLLVVMPDGSLSHRTISDLPELLDSRDALVLNDTRVISARLKGVRTGRGTASPKVEILVHKRLSADTFAAFARPARKLEPGDTLLLGRSLKARILARGEGGEVDVRFEMSGKDLDAGIDAEGEVPLPPYIAGKRPADIQDLSDYQTVFARREGSVAAPTAGLHFTPDLLERLAARGLDVETVTLHVGAGTFLPVSAEDTDAHRMHSEWAEVTAETAAHLNARRSAGGRIVAAGTTALRTLETASSDDGKIAPFTGDTDIFIKPGYRFKAVDVLLTNFHLPRSTLFMLVCAFSGLDVMRRAYAEAIREKYRFYSYGDACLLFRPA